MTGEAHESRRAQRANFREKVFRLSESSKDGCVAHRGDLVFGVQPGQRLFADHARGDFCGMHRFQIVGERVDHAVNVFLADRAFGACAPKSFGKFASKKGDAAAIALEHSEIFGANLFVGGKAKPAF